MSVPVLTPAFQDTWEGQASMVTLQPPTNNGSLATATGAVKLKPLVMLYRVLLTVILTIKTQKQKVYCL